MKIQIKDISVKLTSPWLVALVPFVLTLVFSSTYFQKYKLELISKGYIKSNQYYYADLNHDGNSEMVRFTTYQNAEVLVYTIDGKLEEVYNLPGEWMNSRRKSPVFFVGDANADSLDEIFAITVNSHDSAYISMIQHYSKKKNLRNKFICKLQKSDQVYDYDILPLGLADNNGDGSPEFLFVINAGFPLQPRAVYAWDIKNDSIYRSPLMGVAIKSTPYTCYLQDVDGDSIKEIFLRTVAVDNDKDSIPYDDHSSWVMIFTKDLNFLFQPTQISGEQTNLYLFPYTKAHINEIGISICNERSNNQYPSFAIYDLKGEKVRETKLREKFGSIFTSFYKENGRYYSTSINGGSLRISIFNKSLDKIERNLYLPGANSYLTFCDLDQDGEKEVITYSKIDKKIIVLRDDMSHPVEAEIGLTDEYSEAVTSVAFKNGKPDHFVFDVDGTANYLKYSKNPWYYFNFVFAAIYYFLLVFILAQLKRIWLANLQRKHQSEQKMQQLQMQTIMNQLNPHFTYNAISTIGSAILNESPQDAYERLIKVTHLMRRIVDHAFIPYKTLGQEIDFIQDYLEVEKVRFGERLEYDIRVDESVNLKTKVPKMLIQLFVENSLKHGLFHKKGTGKILISISSELNGIKIVIEDNGIGRQKASEHLSGKTGKGLTILQNYLKLFKEQFGTEITFELSDILENGEVAGTRVEVMIHE